MNPLDSKQIQAAALALREARENHSPIGQISVSHGIQGLDAAYAVAEINVEARVAAGARIIGKKVGLTSKSVQQQLGVDQPDFGILFDDMEYLDQDQWKEDLLTSISPESVDVIGENDQVKLYGVKFYVAGDARNLRQNIQNFS